MPKEIGKVPIVSTHATELLKAGSGDRPIHSLYWGLNNTYYNKDFCFFILARTHQEPDAQSHPQGWPVPRPYTHLIF